MLFFSIYGEKNNEVIAENRFRTVASRGACERLAVLNWRSSSIHPSSSLCNLYRFSQSEERTDSQSASQSVGERWITRALISDIHYITSGLQRLAVDSAQFFLDFDDDWQG